jgi:predicted nicotinamide N-methyase
MGDASMRDVAVSDRANFIRGQTVPVRTPLVPEITLHLATEITPIWQATEDWLRRANVDPPFWAFAWAGGQALARYVLDHPRVVRGRRVLDFGAGCGIAAIACARGGAAHVTAAEIDPLAVAAILLNAEINAVEIEVAHTDLVGAPCAWDVILCGDVCYEAPMSARILPWLRRLAAVTEVWLADPGRAYLPGYGLTATERYRVPTSRELEDQLERIVTIWRLRPDAGAG